MKAEEVAALLYEALGEPAGLAVETNNPELLRQRLYTERRKDAALENLSIHISPSNPSGEVWIVNKKGDADAG
jgi:hypothetical protein